MKQATTGTITYEEKKEIRKLAVKGQEMEFDVTYYDGTSGALLACMVALATLDDPRINRVLREFKIRLEDSKGQVIDFGEESR